MAALSSDALAARPTLHSIKRAARSVKRERMSADNSQHGALATTQFSLFGIMSRLTKTLTAASAITCGLVVAILAASYFLGGRPHTVALTSSLSIGIREGRMEFGSPEGAEGSRFVRSLQGGRETVRDSDWTVWDYGVRQRTFTDARGNMVERDKVLIFPGICFLQRRCGQEPVFWTLVASLWYPVLVMAGLPAVSVLRRWRGGGPNERRAGDETTGPAAPDHRT